MFFFDDARVVSTRAVLRHWVARIGMEVAISAGSWAGRGKCPAFKQCDKESPVSTVSPVRISDPQIQSLPRRRSRSAGSKGLYADKKAERGGDVSVIRDP